MELKPKQDTHTIDALAARFGLTPDERQDARVRRLLFHKLTLDAEIDRLKRDAEIDRLKRDHAAERMMVKAAADFGFSSTDLRRKSINYAIKALLQSTLYLATLQPFAAAAPTKPRPLQPRSYSEEK